MPGFCEENCPNINPLEGRVSRVAYLRGIKVTDARSGWISFSLHLGTIIEEKIVPPAKRRERSCVPFHPVSRAS